MVAAAKKHPPSLELERLARSRSKKPICVLGIDEVGTGTLAGPIVTAAVAFPDDEEVIPAGIRDSKILSSSMREKLVKPIMDASLVVGIGYVSPKEIDTWGMQKAKETAIIRAYREASKSYTGGLGRLVGVVDGRNLHKLRKKLGGAASVFSDQADQKSYSVAAASILAKVIRDDIMHDCAKMFPHYKFETNVGYGTEAHLEAIMKHGACAIHRMSNKRVQKILKEREQNGVLSTEKDTNNEEKPQDSQDS